MESGRESYLSPYLLGILENFRNFDKEWAYLQKFPHLFNGLNFKSRKK
jgi:hypothetical protein